MPIIQTNELIRQRMAEQRLLALHAASAQLAAERDPQRLIPAILERSIDLIGAGSGTFYRWDDDAQLLRVAHNYRIPPSDTTPDQRPGQGVAGYVALAWRTLLVNDYPAWEHAMPSGLTAGLRAALAVPLIRAEQLLGVIVARSYDAARFTPDDRRLLELFADQAAIALENARLHAIARAELAERRKAEIALRASEERFRSAFAHAAIGMALVGLDGRWQRVNRAVCALLDYEEAALLATDFQALTHPDDLDLDLDRVRALLAGEISTYQLEKRYRRRDGRFVWALLSVSLVRGEGGAPLHFISQIQDIDARKRAEEELRASQASLAHLAMHDPLTGLANRRRLAQKLEATLANAQQHRLPAALICLDLDGFKSVNDSLGHQAGDRLLITVADRLRTTVREGDTVARLGGDEFAILLDRADQRSASALASRLISALAAPVPLGPATATITASAGVALAAPGEIVEDLLRRADALLYRAKHAGKNRYAIEAPAHEARA